MIFPAKMFHVHSHGSLTEPLCPDTDYSNGLELGGGGLDNAVDTGANLDDVNCDYLGTCYDGQHFNSVFKAYSVLQWHFNCANKALL